jgi:hypothetical protein
MSLENLPLFVLQVSFVFCIIGAVSILKALVAACQKRCEAYSRLHDVTYLQTVPVPPSDRHDNVIFGEINSNVAFFHNSLLCIKAVALRIE